MIEWWAEMELPDSLRNGKNPYCTNLVIEPRTFLLEGDSTTRLALPL